MQYTVWSRGELIGETALGFRSLGFDQCRSGHFHPNARGCELMEALASDSHCMRAYLHRDYRDAQGNDLLDAEYVGSDWFGDLAEHFHKTAEYALELRDEHNQGVRTLTSGIQDTNPVWRPSSEESNELRLPDTPSFNALVERHKEPLAPEEAQKLRAQFDQQMAKEWEDELLDEIENGVSLQMPGMDYDSTPLDLTTAVCWGDAESQGINELGCGWNTTLRDMPTFPRYQVHAILAAG